MAATLPEHSEMHPACRRTPPAIRVRYLTSPRHAFWLPRSRPTYATSGYNSHPRKGNPPSTRLSPLPPNRCWHATQQSTSVVFGTSGNPGRTPTVCPARLSADGVSYCAQSLPLYRSLLPASSTFDLFFKVLFTFRSHYFFAIGLEVIFSFRRELPPTLVWSPNHTDS